MSEPIKFSREALDAFKGQLRKVSADVKGIRLGVRGGSCSGYQYVIEFDYDLCSSRDVEWRPDGWDEVNFRIDKKSLLLLSGSTVAWEKTLMREGFKFENPNEASRCGCGQSFSTK